MTIATFAASGSGLPSTRPTYQPGICNIGPEEISMRRRAGHVGLLVTVVIAAALLAVHAPPFVRLLLALPAAGAAISYLQAVLRFCAGFGVRGVFNFGPLGERESTVDVEALRRDRRRAREIFAAGLAIGIVLGVIAAVLPV